jgi:hypothetical protein
MLARAGRALPGTEHRSRRMRLENHPGTYHVASGYAVNPLGLEFLEKPFHTVLIVLTNQSDSDVFSWRRIIASLFGGSKAARHKAREVGKAPFASVYPALGLRAEVPELMNIAVGREAMLAMSMGRSCYGNAIPTRWDFIVTVPTHLYR